MSTAEHDLDTTPEELLDQLEAGWTSAAREIQALAHQIHSLHTAEQDDLKEQISGLQSQLHDSHVDRDNQIEQMRHTIRQAIDELRRWQYGDPTEVQFSIDAAVRMLEAA